MYGVIKVEEKEIPMLATAATPIRYRQVFKKNLLPYFMGKATDEEAAEMVGELAYIMAKAADGAEMSKLSFDGYVEWLDGFSPLAFVDADVVKEIIKLYQGNESTQANVKKNHARQSAK